jgi:serine/threonine protein kinase/roadblock/LC7 domain-containing protein
MKDALPARVRLGAVEVNLRVGELREGERTILLQDQPFQILQMLIERGGELVTREEIKKKFWPNDTVVEFDHSINAAIRKLRRALDDSADDPKYIETIPRRGYRLMVPVERLVCAEVSPAEALPQVADNAAGRLPKPPDSGALVGRTVSHYRVLDIIGGGGMGVVYRAEDLKLGRRVALKFLPEEMGTDLQALERFDREARAVSSLDHPNICTIHEFGEHEDRPFMVMQMLQGQTLRDRLAASEGPLPLEKLLDVAIQVSAGLQAAHERGIIHRDIKPANIFITDKGVCKILDFGVAKLLEVGVEDELAMQPCNPAVALTAPAGASHLTRTGAAMGTAGYMSPEQVRGGKLDGRTDIFSFGLVLYEMTTGQRAFAGETAEIVHDAILNRTAVPVQDLNSAIPSKLGEIINKALQKDRAKRYSSTAEVRSELESLVEVTTKSARLKHRTYVTLAAALVVLTAFAWFGYRNLVHHVSAVAGPVSYVSLTERENVSGPATISSDGKYFAYQEKVNGKSSLWIQQVSTGSSLKVTPEMKSAIVEDVAFSPDSTILYYQVRDVRTGVNLLYRVPTLGGTPEVFIAGALGAVGFSPDGNAIAYRQRGPDGRLQLMISKANGSGPQMLYAGGTETIASPTAPAWSPDGKLIAISEWALGGGRKYSTISLIDLNGRRTELTGDKQMEVFKLAWLPDGSGIVFIGNPYGPEPEHIFLASYPAGLVTRITNDPISYDVSSLGITADARSLFAIRLTSSGSFWIASDSFRNVKELSLGGALGPLSQGLGLVGQRIFYYSNVGDTSGIWRSDSDGSPPIRITPSDISVGHMSLSPDGAKVAFEVLTNARLNIWLSDAQGGGLRQLTNGSRDQFPVFSPDGSDVVFSRVDKDTGHLYRVSGSGGQPTLVSDTPLGFATSTRPSGDILCQYFDAKARRGMIAIVSLRNGRLLRVLDFPGWASQPRFTPDGKGVSYIDDSDGASNIWYLPLQGGPSRRLTNFTSEEVKAYVWSLDGTRLLMARELTSGAAFLMRNFAGASQR